MIEDEVGSPGGLGAWGQRADRRLLGGGVLAVLGSLWLPWAHTGFDGGGSLLGRELTSAIVVALVLLLAASAVGARPAHRIARRGCLVVSGISVAGLALFLIALESIAAAIPRDVLPATIRRLSIEIAGGSGAWLALAGAATILVGALGVTAGVSLRGLDWQRVAGALGPRLPAVVILLAAAGVGVARYESWTDAGVAGQSTSVEGFALPWAGPLTLVAVWVLLVAGGVSLVRPWAAPSLAAVLAAWLASFLAAIVMIGSSLLAEVRIDAWIEDLDLPSAIADPEPWVETGRGAWLTFAAACLAVVAALIQMGQWRRNLARSAADDDDWSSAPDQRWEGI